MFAFVMEGFGTYVSIHLKVTTLHQKLQLSMVLIEVIFAITLRNMRQILAFFLLLLEMICALNMLKRFPPYFNSIVILPC